MKQKSSSHAFLSLNAECHEDSAFLLREEMSPINLLNFFQIIVKVIRWQVLYPRMYENATRLPLVRHREIAGYCITHIIKASMGRREENLLPFNV